MNSSIEALRYTTIKYESLEAYVNAEGTEIKEVFISVLKLAIDSDGEIESVSKPRPKTGTKVQKIIIRPELIKKISNCKGDMLSTDLTEIFS